MLFKSFVTAAVAVLLSAVPVRAAMVTYILDQTNADHLNGALPDGVPYLNVTIDDDGGVGGIGGDALIHFSVTVVGLTYNDPNHGIMDFAFNITNDLITLTTDNIIFPAELVNWEAMHFNGTTDIKATNADGFGRFDVRLTDGGQQRVDPLEFWIDAGGDSIYSYLDRAVNTGAGQSQPDAWFGAHVAGFDSNTFSTDGTTEGVECYEGSPCIEIPTAWFGGGVDGTPPASVVPEPLSAALVGTALLGLVAIRRKMA